jgi:uncharacterized protein with von Willebrand factor type A (vWA) domain
MTKEELLRMLDLEAKEASPVSESLPITQAVPTSRATPASPTALRLDEWCLRRGEDVLKDNKALQKCLSMIEDRQRQSQAVADFHAAAYEVEPTLNENCSDPVRWEFVKQLMETPEFHELRASTMLHDTASEIAAVAFASQYAELRKEREQDETKGRRDKDSASHGFVGEIAVVKHVSKALSEAAKEVEVAKDAAAALGMGPGSPGSNDPRAIAALYKRVRSDPTLRRICELAGRFRRVAQSKQRRKTTHGLDDVVGVVMDADLGRLLPHELAKLAIPEFEDDTLRRFVERQTMCREYHATEPVAKGPILVSVDESGSMEGEKVHTAKALALALAWIARQHRRWCGLVAYSGDSGERLLALPPGRWNEVALMDWLAQFIGMGSNLDVPVRELPDYYRKLGSPVGKTDVIFITDAQCRIPAKLQEEFVHWKEQVQARLISLIIDDEPGDLAHISDEIHKVPSLAVSAGAVERVLSL